MSFAASKAYAVILSLFVSGALFVISAQSGKPGEQTPPLTNRELAAQVRKSLVVVLTQDHEGNAIAQGSGFFFKAGLIATNLHVLKRASQGYVKSLSDGVSYKISSVVGFDLKHDICVLKLSDAGGAALRLSTDEVAVGDDVLVAGNPEGLEASFSRGIVSAVRPGSGLIQMDAPISPGSSGGPVVNQHGEVVGLAVSTLVVGQNLNFAVPIRYLREQKLIWHLGVRTAGGLAVNGLEEAGFHGRVRSVIESQADYTFNEVRNTDVEGPAVPQSASKFNPDGQVEETTFFRDGAENGKQLQEYSDEGLIRRIIDIDSQERRQPQEYSTQDSVYLMGATANFDRTVGIGTEGERQYHEDTYDSGGHLLTKVFPQQGVRYVMKYDPLGREVEKLAYKQDRQDFATRSAYEDNGHGDWIRRHETIWLAKHPERGFAPFTEYYREIAYWGEDGR